jgi:hypothetical protein
MRDWPPRSRPPSRHRLRSSPSASISVRCPNLGQSFIRGIDWGDTKAALRFGDDERREPFSVRRRCPFGGIGDGQRSTRRPIPESELTVAHMNRRISLGTAIPRKSSGTGTTSSTLRSGKKPTRINSSKRRVTKTPGRRSINAKRKRFRGTTGSSRQTRRSGWNAATRARWTFRCVSGERNSLATKSEHSRSVVRVRPTNPRPCRGMQIRPHQRKSPARGRAGRKYYL